MASIASPRIPPASGDTTPTLSSRRTSLDTNVIASPHLPLASATPTVRRNRAALRDYYNLKPPAAVASSASSVSETTETFSHEDDASGESRESELDQPGFKADAYVRGLLDKQGLQGLLKAEEGLLNEIRELDGERKALVYDNYSKLIDATETIKKMRSNMEPLGSSTGDLERMVGRIAETAGLLSHGSSDVPSRTDDRKGAETGAKEWTSIERQKQTVRWVVESPRRFRMYVRKGETQTAEVEWDKVKRLLEKWKGHEGVKAIHDGCMEVLAQNGNVVEDTD